MSYRIDIYETEHSKPVHNGLRFPHKVQAAEYLMDLGLRWFGFHHGVPRWSTDPPTHTYVDGALNVIVPIDTRGAETGTDRSFPDSKYPEGVQV